MEITPEIQAAIDAAVEQATTKLKQKNSELIADVRKLNNLKSEAEEAAQAASEEAATKSGDIEAIKTQLTDKHSKALKALQDQLDASQGRLSSMLIDDAITKSMVENNVAAHMHEPLKAMFKSQAKLTDGVAQIGDQALSEYLPAYWQSEAGKHYVPAPVNKGTGSQGVQPTPHHGYTKESLTLTEFSRLAREDPANANAIAASVGSSYKA